MRFVLIRPGRFAMGSPGTEQGRDRNEGPQHEVAITKPFYLGVTEVTQAQYEAIMETNPSKFKGPTNPVDSVDWKEAAEFCRKLSEKTDKAFRLPTEAEWEYACRAGTPARYFFGDSDNALAEYAWWHANSENKTHPVGQKKPNTWGLYDMLGNVLEWCADRYGSYPSEASVDPQGPDSGSARVTRGGSYDYGKPDNFRCAFRFSFYDKAFKQRYGFRCAMTIP